MFNNLFPKLIKYMKIIVVIYIFVV